MNLRNFQIVRDSLSHPIEVHSIFVDVAGSVEGGYLLSQVYRWVEWAKPTDGWFVWNEEQWMRETHMRDFEILRARNALSQVADSNGNPVWEEAQRNMSDNRLSVHFSAKALHRVIVEYVREKEGESMTSESQEVMEKVDYYLHAMSDDDALLFIDEIKEALEDRVNKIEDAQESESRFWEGAE